MKIKLHAVLFLWIFIGSASATASDVVTLWTTQTASGDSYMYFIEKKKLPKLRVIDILIEEPELSLKEAAKAGLKEAKKRNQHIEKYDAIIQDITLHIKSIGSTKFSYYEVEIVIKRDGSEIGREFVPVLLDGEAISRDPLRK